MVWAKALIRAGLYSCYHPDNSLDLSPSEPIWKLLKHHVYQQRPHNKAKLRYITKEWDKLITDEI
jgi:hypothetical protein